MNIPYCFLIPVYVTLDIFAVFYLLLKKFANGDNKVVKLLTLWLFKVIYDANLLKHFYSLTYSRLECIDERLYTLKQYITVGVCTYTYLRLWY